MGNRNNNNNNEERPRPNNRPNRPNRPVGRQPGSARWNAAAARAARRGNQSSQTSIESQAQQDVQAAYQPALTSYDEAMAGVNSAYGGYAAELAPLAGQYQAATANLASDLTRQVGELTGMLGQSGSTGELAASAGYFGNIGATGLEGLASAGSRVGGWLSAAAAEGSAAERAALDNLMQGKMGLSKEMAQQVLARMDELRAARLDQTMQQKAMRMEKKYLNSQMKSEAAYAQLLEDQIRGVLGNDKQGPGGRRGNRGNQGPRGRNRGADVVVDDGPRGTQERFYTGKNTETPNVTGAREGGDYAGDRQERQLAQQLRLVIAAAKSSKDLPDWLVRVWKNPTFAQYLTPTKRAAYALIRKYLNEKMKAMANQLYEGNVDSYPDPPYTIGNPGGS